MTYVDGFLIPIAKDKVDAYKEMASGAKDIWMKHGALQYFECVGEDLHPKAPEGMEDMQSIHFPDMLGLDESKTVIFAFIIFKDRAHRDAVNAAVMEDPDMAPDKWEGFEMPFDCTQTVYGGFRAIVQN